jgi:hypothetical protein
MKPGTALCTALLALASTSLWAQQSSPTNPQSTPAPQQNPPAAAPETPSPAASPETPPAAMSPVNGELLSKLDSKTAKTGDDFVVRTNSSIKIADGTEVPKGSKLVGHVIAVQPSQAGANSQVAVKFDHIELKGGQNIAVLSQIQSIAPPGGAESGATGSPGMSGPATGPAASGSASAGASASRGASGANSTPQSSGAPDSSSAAAGAPAAGTVVARSGQITIQTTSVPGVLLANNAPGQADPRMSQVSSILLGARRDIQLDGGTQVVVGIASTNGGTR